MKIKVFKFEVSNATSEALRDDFGSDWFRKGQSKLVSPTQIENIINEFCHNKDIVDIKINNVDVKYHNNARGNTVELWYTIMYKEV